MKKEVTGTRPFGCFQGSQPQTVADTEPTECLLWRAALGAGVGWWSWAWRFVSSLLYFPCFGSSFISLASSHILPKTVSEVLGLLLSSCLISFLINGPCTHTSATLWLSTLRSLSWSWGLGVFVGAAPCPGTPVGRTHRGAVKTPSTDNQRHPMEGASEVPLDLLYIWGLQGVSLEGKEASLTLGWEGLLPEIRIQTSI
jgi:hypothetical protein